MAGQLTAAQIRSDDGERRIGQEALFYEFSLERHVPERHLLRSIDRFVDLDGQRQERFRGNYPTRGRVEAVEWAGDVRLGGQEEPFIGRVTESAESSVTNSTASRLRAQQSGLPKVLLLFSELLPEQRLRPEHMCLKVLRHVLRQGRF